MPTQENTNQEFLNARLKDNSYFIIPYVLFFIVLLAAIVQYPKAELHLVMNKNHSAFADWFFSAWTELGGILITGLFILFMFFYRYSITAYLAVSQIIGFVISSLAKYVFGELRPVYYFSHHFPEVTLPIVPGVAMYTNPSFPSGHTVNAFILFFGLSLCVKNKWIKLLFFASAALVGYSRVYLSQHFAIDILAGSLIGVLSAGINFPLLVILSGKWKKQSLTDVFLKNNQDKFADK